MAQKKFNSLSKSEQDELRDLIQKKKAKTISKEEAARLAELNEKCGFKGGKSSSKEGFRPGNDFSWWNKEPELLKDAANFKCNYIAGSEIAGADLPYVIPGILVTYLRSIYGADSKATDALNVWARDLYLRMFHNFRPASGYTASDLGIAIIAGIEVVKVIAKYERIYGIINRYSKLNLNMPYLEATALGLSSADVDYLQGHMSDFRYDLNYLIRKAQRLCIPKDISAIADAISLFGYEYLDHENPRAQFVLFDTETIGVYSDTALSTGGSIQWQSPSTTWFDFTKDNMCVALEDVLNPLLGSDSIQRIYADLVVWFGADAMLAMVPIPEDYIVVPVYSESILHKLHNAECMSSDINDHLTSWAYPGLPTADESAVLNGTYHVYQANDTIITKGVIIGSGAATPDTCDGGKALFTGTVGASIQRCHLLDTYRVEPDAEVVTEGVLFKNNTQSNTAPNLANNYNESVTTAAFYLVENIRLYSQPLTPGGAANYTDNCNVVYNAPGTAQSRAGRLSVIDWAPLMYNITPGVAPWLVDEIYGDMDNVIPMYHNDIARLQRTIMLSGMHTDVKSIR